MYVVDVSNFSIFLYINQEEAITVSAFGQTKTVQDRQVLIVKQKSGGRTDSAKLTQATDDVRSALKSIPVDNTRKTNTGSLVVKFPTAEAKSEASDLMSSCFENNDDFVVSQPKKMLPKMTLTGIPSSFPEGEIIDGILSKNKKIKNLCEEGLHLSLLFVKQKDQNEHKVAVLKMAPEIRKTVNETGGYVYLGLSRCRAYDRFWVMQCFHCQRFGYIATKCPSKKEAAVCVYCAGHHKSSDCPDKSNPKCANCSAHTAPGVSCSHYALSPDCPMMALQGNIVIEGVTSPLHESRLMWIHDPHRNQPSRDPPSQLPAPQKNNTVPRTNNTVPRSNNKVPRNIDNVPRNSPIAQSSDVACARPLKTYPVLCGIIQPSHLALITVPQCPGIT